MMKDIKVVLERALDVIGLYAPNHEILEQISDILASEQEPVAWIRTRKSNNETDYFSDRQYKHEDLFEWQPLYLHPSQDKAKIASLELENKTLREALEIYSSKSNWICDDDLKHSSISIGNAYEIADQALYTPTSTEQLDAYCENKFTVVGCLDKAGKYISASNLNLDNIDERFTKVFIMKDNP